MVVYFCNPSIQETEAEGWRVPGQGYAVRPCLKERKKERNNNKESI
jgi:hypothetical protein